MDRRRLAQMGVPKWYLLYRCIRGYQLVTPLKLMGCVSFSQEAAELKTESSSDVD